MDDSAIHIDMTNALMNLPVASLVRLANVALNSMNMRKLSEVAFHAGLEIDLMITETTNG